MDRPLRILSDGELVELAQEGNRDAFESLFHRHQNRVYTLAFTILRNSQDAKDVVQETFVKTYTRIHSLHKDKHVLAYLLKTASNAAIDVIRARKAHPALSLTDSPDLPSSAHRNPQTSLQSAEHTDEIIRAILDLSDEHRLVVVLHHIEDLPLDQIAERLDVPVGTVKSRLGRAREVLRRKLTGRLL